MKPSEFMLTGFKMTTTLEKAEVMIASDRGLEIESLAPGAKTWVLNNAPSWNWQTCDFRIALKPVEPAECWMWIYTNGEHGGSFSSRKKAEEYHEEPGRAVLMREVIE